MIASSRDAGDLQDDFSHGDYILYLDNYNRQYGKGTPTTLQAAVDPQDADVSIEDPLEGNAPLQKSNLDNTPNARAGKRKRVDDADKAAKRRRRYQLKPPTKEEWIMQERSFQDHL
jgi:hypothetical protein